MKFKMVGVKGKSGVYKRTFNMKTGKYKKSEKHKKKIKESCKNCPVIHHINGNHFDDREKNRMVVTPSEHAKIHILQGDLHIFKKGYMPWNKRQEV